MTTAEKASNLARVLDAGHFAVAVEISPPIGPNPQALQRQIDRVKGYADVYNVTDNQSARVHMASLPACIKLKDATATDSVCRLISWAQPPSASPMSWRSAAIIRYAAIIRMSNRSATSTRSTWCE